MECEICGKNTKLLRARIEDAVMSVCSDCAKFGEVIPEQKIEKKPEERPLEFIEVDPSYPSIVKLKREALGLTREQLAKKLNEKISVIERIEHGKMRPDNKVAKKLEKALGIKILGYHENEVKIEKKPNKDVTLGDVVELKIKKRK